MQDWTGVVETFGMDSWSGAGVRASSAEVSRIAKDRAEILELIHRLAAERRARAARNGSGSVAPQELKPSTGSNRTRASERGMRSDTNGNIALEMLERRLQLVEAALVAKRHSSRAPPPDDEATFSGLIRGQMLSDMLQLVSSNNMSGHFVVQNGDSKCTLYFDDGRICHAEGPGLQGEQAFFSAFGFESGRYFFIETTELPAARTIEAGTQFLILEALRQVDESKAT